MLEYGHRFPGRDDPLHSGKQEVLQGYVLNYTNVSFIVGNGFYFKDGLFSGYEPRKRKYEKDTWVFDKDAKGIPPRDMSLTYPRSVFHLLKMHDSRYTLDNVLSITGVSKENLLKVYASTGVPDKALLMSFECVMRILVISLILFRDVMI